MSLTRHLKTLATKLALAFIAAGPMAVQAAPKDPVLMIPGMGGGIENMNDIQSHLASKGWPTDRLIRWTDSSKMQQDMAQAAAELSSKVDSVLQSTGASKVILITWSASTIASRYYIKNLGGLSKVSQYIAFAGPQHGISNWTLCQSTPSCAQWGPADSPFLKALNSGTEVPGHPTIRYLTVRSTGDTNASPVDTAVLQGADENFLLSGAMAPTHFTIIKDSKALNKMSEFMLNNVITDPGAPSMSSCTASVAGSGASISGAATDSDGVIASYRVQLAGPTAVNDAAAGSGASFSKSYALADGFYSGTVVATDNAGKTSAACAIAQFRVGQAPYSQSIAAPVYTHFIAGRLNVTQYNQLGVKYGYTSTVTLYLCSSGWTDSNACVPIGS